jgi:predicted TIM-barrel fold metal-dependent hydrolase
MDTTVPGQGAAAESLPGRPFDIDSGPAYRRQSTIGHHIHERVIGWHPGRKSESRPCPPGTGAGEMGDDGGASGGQIMTAYRVISADSHIVEPPDLYDSRLEPKFRERAPRMERHRTRNGQEYDAWYFEGVRVGTVGSVIQAGKRFEDPSSIDFLGLWEDVRKAAYEPHAMLAELERDGVWGACLQPSQGLFWYRLANSELLSALCRAYNGWIADFCQAAPDRFKGVGMLNVDDVDDACQELEHCAELGLRGAFIPVSPLSDRPYRHPMYDRLWWTAQDLDMPLLLHVATPRGGIPGCEFTIDINELTAAGLANSDYWIRYSLTAMIFAGVFDRYPRLQVGSVEHETAWVPHWLKQMDFTYRERPTLARSWRSRHGLLPSDYWRRNMFVEFMEDDFGIRLRDVIGVDNMLWGNDFPHAESTWPKSREFLDRIFAGAPEEDRRKIISDNAAKLFRFSLP